VAAKSWVRETHAEAPSKHSASWLQGQRSTLRPPECSPHAKYTVLDARAAWKTEFNSLRTWQGTLPLSRMGSPLMRASAMVPGPALVMMVSTAAIHCGQHITADSPFQDSTQHRTHGYYSHVTQCSMCPSQPTHTLSIALAVIQAITLETRIHAAMRPAHTQ
jgi:hypothetical protein